MNERESEKPSNHLAAHLLVQVARRDSDCLRHAVEAARVDAQGEANTPWDIRGLLLAVLVIVSMVLEALPLHRVEDAAGENGVVQSEFDAAADVGLSGQVEGRVGDGAGRVRLGQRLGADAGDAEIPEAGGDDQ